MFPNILVIAWKNQFSLGFSLWLCKKGIFFTKTNFYKLAIESSEEFPIWRPLKEGLQKLNFNEMGLHHNFPFFTNGKQKMYIFKL